MKKFVVSMMAVLTVFIGFNMDSVEARRDVFVINIGENGDLYVDEDSAVIDLHELYPPNESKDYEEYHSISATYYTTNGDKIKTVYAVFRKKNFVKVKMYIINRDGDYILYDEFNSINYERYHHATSTIFLAAWNAATNAGNPFTATLKMNSVDGANRMPIRIADMEDTYIDMNSPFVKLHEVYPSVAPYDEFYNIQADYRKAEGDWYTKSYSVYIKKKSVKVREFVLDTNKENPKLTAEFDSSNYKDYPALEAFLLAWTLCAGRDDNPFE